jgi:hypothetical protein
VHTEAVHVAGDADLLPIALHNILIDRRWAERRCVLLVVAYRMSSPPCRHASSRGARFCQDAWHPTQWGGCCDGVNGAILEVFVTDTRQQALAAYERDAS